MNIVEESKRTGRPIIEVATGKEVTEYIVGPPAGCGSPAIWFVNHEGHVLAPSMDGSDLLALKPATATIWFLEWNLERAAIRARIAELEGGAKVPREPTEAMLAVVKRMRPAVGSPEQLANDGYCVRWDQRHRHNAIEIWQAMYDAALTPPSAGAV